MSDNNKVVKFKKRRTVNIGVIVFLILFLYISIHVYFYFTNDQLSIYEVHEGSTAVDNRITGLILREEQIIASDKAGYVSYYQKEGARVAKNASVYSINENQSMSDILASTDVPITLTEKESAELIHKINSFRNSYSDADYDPVYDFKENVQSSVLDILNTTLLENERALMQQSGENYAQHIITSAESGIITYYIDGFETITADMVTADMFNLDNYKRTSLRTTSIIDQNTPIYTLITSEQWKLVLPLTKEQYEKLNGKEQVTFTILQDDFRMTAALALQQKGSEYYGILTMNKYLSNYLDERFLEVELDFDTIKGLKIPVSSIVEKDFYLVPLEYLSMGADSTDTGLIVETYDGKTGEAIFTFTPTDIYYQDDAYAYVDAKQFAAGTYIHSSTSSERYTLGPTNKLTGVYNVNLGYAVFRRIVILYQNEEYCIVEKNTPYGLSAYDHIALDGSTAEDQAIISKNGF